MSAAPGVTDLAWHLVSSADPARWDETIAAYRASAGPAPVPVREGLAVALPPVIVQGLLSLADTPSGSPESAAWITRLDAACCRLP